MDVLRPCLKLVEDRGYELRAFGRLDSNCAVVLCNLPDNSVTPYVTWIYAYGGFTSGHYHKTLEEASSDFTQRFRPRESVPLGDLVGAL